MRIFRQRIARGAIVSVPITGLCHQTFRLFMACRIIQALFRSRVETGSDITFLIFQKKDPYNHVSIRFNWKKQFFQLESEQMGN